MLDHSNAVSISGRVITTPRLRLKPWNLEDAEEALRIFGSDEVARWLAPAMSQVSDLEEMRDLLLGWVASEGNSERPTGRWAVEELETGRIVGAAAVRPLPPQDEDLEIGWQLAPEARDRIVPSIGEECYSIAVGQHWGTA